MMYRFRTALTSAAFVVAIVGASDAQATFRETGSLNVGGNLVWVRGTNERSVQLFVGRGYHDAFARPHEVDAVRLQHWIDSVRSVMPQSADDTTEAQVRLSVLSSDVTLMRRSGGPFSGMRVLLTGEDPITMAEPTAKDFLAMLDSAAHVSRELSTPAGLASGPLGAGGSADQPTLVRSAPLQIAEARVAPVVPAPAVAPPVAPPVAVAPVAVAPVAVAPVAVASPTVVAPVAAAPALRVPVKNTPAAKRTVDVAMATAPAPKVDSVVAPVGATVAAPEPDLVLPAPQAPVLLLASRMEILPLPPVTPPPPPAAPVVKAAPAIVIEKPATLPVVAPTPPPAPPVVAAAVVTAVPAPAPAPVAATPTTSPAPATPPAVDSAPVSKVEPPADKLIHTPLGPFTIPAELLSDRDKEAQYCYRKLGLKYSPDLTGEITVKLTVGGDGVVSDAVVTKRTWQGISAGEVEACVRALAHDWTFPVNDPAVAAGAKLLTFTFTP